MLSVPAHVITTTIEIPDDNPRVTRMEAVLHHVPRLLQTPPLTKPFIHPICVARPVDLLLTVELLPHMIPTALLPIPGLHMIPIVPHRRNHHPPTILTVPNHRRLRQRTIRIDLVAELQDLRAPCLLVHMTLTDLVVLLVEVLLRGMLRPMIPTVEVRAVHQAVERSKMTIQPMKPTGRQRNQLRSTPIKCANTQVWILAKEGVRVMRMSQA